MMQTITNYRKIMALLFLIFSTGMVNAQRGDNFIASRTTGYYFNPQNIGLSTPQASDFVTYGNVDVNHYNGLLNMSIELDGYKDNDFDLPMSIKYVSSGFIPFKRPSVVGYNWFFNFGGMITRTVKGSPDDTKGNYENSSSRYIKDGLLVAIRNNTFGYYGEQTLTGFQMPMNSGSHVPYLWGDFKHDYEPDIFNFSFGQHSGSFIIDNNGVPRSLSGNGYKIDITELTIQEYSTTDIPQSSTIRITTPDGFIYEFGGNTTYLEYTIPNNPDKVIIKPRHILSWYLKSIKAPNSRMVEFTYESKLLPNSYSFLLHIYYQMGVAFVNPSIPPSETKKEISEQKTMRDDVHSPIIQKVIIDNNVEIIFQTINGPAFYDGKDSSVHLSKIAIRSGINDVKVTKFTYTTRNRYNFLSRLEKNDQVYDFKYNLPTILPNPLTTSLDHWGFWNGGDITTIDDVKSYCMNVDNNKNTSSEYYNVGLLSKVIYPTKGETEITYEQNRYDRYLEPNLDQEQIDLLSTTSSTLCGGSRVKQIKDYDAATYKTVNQRTFQYIIPQTETGSGIIGSKHKYEATDLLITNVSGGNSYSSVTYTQTVSTNSLGYNENLPEYHIGYSDVTEQFSDGSYIHYHYTSNENMPNDMEGTTYSVLSSDRKRLYVREINGLYIANSLSHFRGKLSRKEIYNAQNVLQQTEKYMYNTDDARNIYNISVATTPRGRASYRLYLTPCLLKKKEIIDANGVNYTEEYQYNNKSILSETKTTNSNGEEIKVQYNYPSDYNYNNLTIAEKKLIDNNILTKPLQVTTLSQMGNSTSRTLDLLSFEYKIENNLPLLYRIKKQDENNHFKILEEYKKYDVYGNPMCILKDNIIETVYLWGYKGQYIMAEIKNSTYNTVAAQLTANGVNMDQLSTLNNTSMYVYTLQEAIPSAHITTYQYSRLIGITKITDPRGIATHFSYDKYGKLKHMYQWENNKMKILEAYEYHYTNY